MRNDAALSLHGEIKMFQLTRNWLAIPEGLYFALLIICAVLAAASVIALVRGIVRKTAAKRMAVWGIVLAVSAAYLIATLGLHVVVANTMLGG